MNRQRLELFYKGEDRSERSILERPKFSLETVAIVAAQGYELAWDGSCAYIAIHDIINVDGEIRGDEIPSTPSLDIRRKLTFLPKGVRITGWCEPTDRLNSFTALYLDQDWFFEQLEIAPQKRKLIPFMHRQDASLLTTMEQLAEIARNPSEFPRLLTDSLSLVAGSHALRHGELFSKKTGGLSETQLSRATDYIEAHLAEDISLTEVATSSGLSVFHFSRAFKKSTGATPYRYVLESRIRLARSFLERDSRQTIAEIAKATGFNSVSSFSRAFSDVVGVSPRAYRKNVKF